jgi:hypothetical protein
MNEINDAMNDNARGIRKGNEMTRKASKHGSCCSCYVFTQNMYFSSPFLLLFPRKIPKEISLIERTRGHSISVGTCRLAPSSAAASHAHAPAAPFTVCLLFV